MITLLILAIFVIVLFGIDAFFNCLDKHGS